MHENIIIPTPHGLEARNASAALEKYEAGSFDKDWEAFQKKFENLNKLALTRLDAF